LGVVRTALVFCVRCTFNQSLIAFSDKEGVLGVLLLLHVGHFFSSSCSFDCSSGPGKSRINDLLLVTFFKDMHVPFDGIAYLIVFNIEGVKASLHFSRLIVVVLCCKNQCYSGLAIFNTPAGV
jgi:hypothetical protein